MRAGLSTRGLGHPEPSRLVLPDAESIGACVAEIVLEQVRRKPASVIGLATGSSPEAAYAVLAERAPAGIFAEARFVALDEYVGLDPWHPQRYASVLAREFLGPLRLPTEVLCVPDGSSEDVNRAADAVESHIAQLGGVDLQLLGIGRNGHIGFNEPGAPWESRTRVVELADVTRRDNARFFTDGEAVPYRAITQGIATILAAGRIVLIAQGPAKADVLARALYSPPTTDVPASALQGHPAVTIVVDEEAGKALGTAREAIEHRGRVTP